MKTIKNILKPVLVLSAVALFFIVAGCDDKKFEWSIPLAVDSRYLILPSDAGSTHVLVYSTGDWTVGFDRDVDWASLDRRTGSGCSEFVLSFSTNYGISRKVTACLASGTHRDSIVFSQTGTLSTASVSFPSSSVTVADTVATITVNFSTDLVYATDYFSSEVTYYDEEGNVAETDPWISNVVVAPRNVYFDVARNGKDLYRKADLRVYIEDAAGTQFGATLSVTQVPAGTAY